MVGLETKTASIVDSARSSVETAALLTGTIKHSEAEFSALAAGDFFLAGNILLDLEKLHLNVKNNGARFFIPILSAQSTLQLSINVAPHCYAALFVLAENAHRDLQVRLVLEDESRLEFFSFFKNAEIELDCTMALAQKAQGLLAGLTQAEKDTHTAIAIRVHHRQKNGKSQQAFYSYARDNAEVGFTGTIVVDPGSDGTVAHQLHRGTLLSKTARIHARPFLNILHDDVRCTHGSTVGFIDEEAIHYLRTRGIDRAVAEAMLVASFERQFFDALPDKKARQFFGQAEEES